MSHRTPIGALGAMEMEMRSTKDLRAMCLKEARQAGFQSAQHHQGAVPALLPEFISEESHQNWWGYHGFAALYERGFWQGFDSYCQQQ
jgi:hypothetical protein